MTNEPDTKILVSDMRPLKPDPIRCRLCGLFKFYPSDLGARLSVCRECEDVVRDLFREFFGEMHETDHIKRIQMDR